MSSRGASDDAIPTLVYVGDCFAHKGGSLAMTGLLAVADLEIRGERGEMEE